MSAMSTAGTVVRVAMICRVVSSRRNLHPRRVFGLSSTTASEGRYSYVETVILVFIYCELCRYRNEPQPILTHLLAVAAQVALGALAEIPRDALDPDFPLLRRLRGFARCKHARENG